MLLRTAKREFPLPAPRTTFSREAHAAPQRILFDLLVLVGAGLAWTTTAAAGENATSEPEQVSFTIERARTREGSEPIALRFDAFGTHVDLVLEKNRMLVAPQTEAQLLGASGTSSVPLPELWTGQGTDGSDARLTFVGDQARGYVRTPSGLLLFEPVTADPSFPTLHSVRRSEDLLPADSPLGCATDNSVEAPLTATTTALPREADVPLRFLDLSVIGDAAFHQRYGDSSVLRMLALLNLVDGLYRRDLGIALRIVQIVVYETEDAQPFPSMLAPGDRVTAVSEARRTDPVLSLAGTAAMHLMTGAGMDGHQGVAWPSTVCDPVYSTSISLIDSKSDHFATLLIAHEIGHTLGAYHDGPDGYGCLTTTRDFVMWPAVDPASTDSFSSCSRERIASRTAVASCMDRTVPYDCGNGILDAEEECDPGTDPDSPCCRADCTWALAGIPCSTDGFACSEASCAMGVCVVSEEPRPLEQVEALIRLTSAGMVDTAKVRVKVPMLTDGGDPSLDGFHVATTITGTMAWEDFVPAHRWIRKSAGKFLYKNPEAVAGQLRSAVLQFDLPSSRATFRLVFARPMASLSPAPPTVSVLSGNAQSGQCGIGDPLRCQRTEGKYRCE